jgi:hypothetical protein
LTTTLGATRQNAGDASHHADNATDSAAEHATDGAGRLVTLARPFLDPLNHLSIHACGCTERKQNHGAKRDT